jgi:hypothetical protein
MCVIPNKKSRIHKSMGMKYRFVFIEASSENQLLMDTKISLGKYLRNGSGIF